MANSWIKRHGGAETFSVDAGQGGNNHTERAIRAIQGAATAISPGTLAGNSHLRYFIFYHPDGQIR